MYILFIDQARVEAYEASDANFCPFCLASAIPSEQGKVTTHQDNCLYIRWLQLEELERKDHHESHTFVHVPRQIDCDICKHELKDTVPAFADARLVTGQWAYVCRGHFLQLGVGLGLGKGQRLVIA